MLLPRQPEAEGGMGLTPLVDVIFLLLIFFVVATTFKEPRIDLTLPEAAEANAPAETSMIVVELRENGEMSVDGAAASLDELDALLVERGARGDGLELRADRDVPHGRVVEVLDRARAHDVLEISIAVEAKRGSG